MSFFGDLKIICNYMFKGSKDKICDITDKGVNNIIEIKDELLSSNIKGKKTLFDYKDISEQDIDIHHLGELNRYKDLFALFGYNKKGILYLTDNVTVNPKYRVEPYISLSADTGYDVYFYDDKNSGFVEFRKLYSDKGKFIRNNRIGDIEEISVNLLKGVSYKIEEDDVCIGYDFGSSGHISLKVGTTLRRHKTSGTAYRDIHEKKLDIITNLCRYKPDFAKIVDADDELLGVNYFGANTKPKLLFDIVNDSLLFCVFDTLYKRTIITKIKSVYFKLDDNDDSTEYVRLITFYDRDILLYTNHKCFLHDRKY